LKIKSPTTLSSLLVTHIPHSSLEVPPNIRDQFVLNDDELDLEIKKITDHQTKEIFTAAFVTASSVVSPVSRLVVDMERFADDDFEEMAKIGMGAIYRNGTAKQQLRRDLDSQEVEDLLDQYYWPHHRHFEQVVSECLAHFDSCLIIDCHSYPKDPLPYELHQTSPRPQICLGTDSFHTPEALITATKDHLIAMGYSVELDTPFAGTIVPSSFYRKNPKVISIMIELRRDLYIDDHFNVVPASRDKLVRNLATLGPCTFDRFFRCPDGTSQDKC